MTAERVGRDYPVTPDGRYFVVRGRLWRMANLALSDDARQALVQSLMEARRAVGEAKRAGETLAERQARETVDLAKRALGERGPVWSEDGTGPRKGRDGESAGGAYPNPHKGKKRREFDGGQSEKAYSAPDNPNATTK